VIDGGGGVAVVVVAGVVCLCVVLCLFPPVETPLPLSPANQQHLLIRTGFQDHPQKVTNDVVRIHQKGPAAVDLLHLRDRDVHPTNILPQVESKLWHTPHLLGRR